MNIKKIKLKISGLDCAACSLLIDQAVDQISGVIESQTSYAKGQVVVKLTSETKIGEIVAKIQQLGYQVNSEFN